VGVPDVEETNCVASLEAHHDIRDPGVKVHAGGVAQAAPSLVISDVL